MKDKIIEYAWSSLTTFVAAFCIAIVPLLGGLPLDKAAIYAVIFAGVRAGVKAVFQTVGGSARF